MPRFHTGLLSNRALLNGGLPTQPPTRLTTSSTQHLFSRSKFCLAHAASKLLTLPRRFFGGVARIITKEQEALEGPDELQARESILAHQNSDQAVYIIRNMQDLERHWRSDFKWEDGKVGAKYMVLLRQGGTPELHISFDGEHLNLGEPGDLLVAAGMLTISNYPLSMEINGLSGGALSYPHNVAKAPPMVPRASECGLVPAKEHIEAILHDEAGAVMPVSIGIGDPTLPLRFDYDRDAYVIEGSVNFSQLESMMEYLRHAEKLQLLLDRKSLSQESHDPVLPIVLYSALTSLPHLIGDVRFI